MKKVIACMALVLSGCFLGHKEVRYSEMAAPPKIKIVEDGIIVKTQNSKENPDFLIYEIIANVDEGEKLILLKCHEARGRDLKHEFKVNLNQAKGDSLKAYKFFWLDPDNKKTEVEIEK